MSTDEFLERVSYMKIWSTLQRYRCVDSLRDMDICFPIQR